MPSEMFGEFTRYQSVVEMIRIKLFNTETSPRSVPSRPNTAFPQGILERKRRSDLHFTKELGGEWITVSFNEILT